VVRSNEVVRRLPARRHSPNRPWTRVCKVMYVCVVGTKSFFFSLLDGKDKLNPTLP